MAGYLHDGMALYLNELVDWETYYRLRKGDNVDRGSYQDRPLHVAGALPGQLRKTKSSMMLSNPTFGVFAITCAMALGGLLAARRVAETLAHSITPMGLADQQRNDPLLCQPSQDA